MARQDTDDDQYDYYSSDEFDDPDAEDYLEPDAKVPPGHHPIRPPKETQGRRLPPTPPASSTGPPSKQSTKSMPGHSVPPRVDRDLKKKRVPEPPTHSNSAPRVPHRHSKLPPQPSTAEDEGLGDYEVPDKPENVRRISHAEKHFQPKLPQQNSSENIEQDEYEMPDVSTQDGPQDEYTALDPEGQDSNNNPIKQNRSSHSRHVADTGPAETYEVINEQKPKALTKRPLPARPTENQNDQQDAYEILNDERRSTMIQDQAEELYVEPEQSPPPTPEVRSPRNPQERPLPAPPTPGGDDYYFVPDETPHPHTREVPTPPALPVAKDSHRPAKPSPAPKNAKMPIGIQQMGFLINTQKLQDVKLRKAVSSDTFQEREHGTSNQQKSGVDTTSSSVHEIKKKFGQSIKEQKGNIRPDSGYNTADSANGSASGVFSNNTPALPTKPNRVNPIRENSSTDHSEAPKLPPPRKMSTGSFHNPHGGTSSPPDSGSGVFTSPVNKNESGLYQFRWYHSDVDRPQTEAKLQKLNTEGGFVVRKCRKNDPTTPYSLSIWCKQRCRHLQIHIRSDGIYAVGNKKPGERTFGSVQELIDYHMGTPLLVGDARNQESVTLTKFPF